MAGLVFSGVTAFPLQTEVTGLRPCSISGHAPIAKGLDLVPWIERVSEALNATHAHYPFLAYGTDWLAFAHLVIAVAFIGPYVDPLRNKWVITFGLIACAGRDSAGADRGSGAGDSDGVAARRLQLWCAGERSAADLQVVDRSLGKATANLCRHVSLDRCLPKKSVAERSKSRFVASLTPSRFERARAPGVLRSATVWIVKGGLMEKRKTMVPFSSFPQSRLRLLTS